MNRRRRDIRAVVWCLLIIVPSLHVVGVASRTARPNIVIIMADDMGFSDIGCYGGEINTPNLDRLAANGLRYTHFYNCAKCHTTRASLMSGLYAHLTGCEVPLPQRATGGKDKPQHSGVSIASVLKQAGYATFASGKWHAGGKPTERGFDHFFGLPGGACSYFTPSTNLVRDDERVKIDPEDDFYFTDAITDVAVNYVEEHHASNEDQPFFLYVAYTAPHWPLHGLREDIAKYRGRYAEGWQAIRQERHQRLIDMGIAKAKWELPNLDPPKSFGSVEHIEWEKRRMEVYAAQVDRMDHGIGRIVESMRGHGVLENTIVFFLSDNGGSQEEIQGSFGWVQSVTPAKTRDGRTIHGGNDPSVMPGPEDTFQSVGHYWGNTNNTPFRYGKVRVHEGGIASPLIVHWPGGIRNRGALRAQMGHVIDLLPTCMELAEATYPQEYRGRATEPLAGLSLVSTFDDHEPDRETLFFEMNGNRAIRTARWKAVTRQGLPGTIRNQVQVPMEYWELYDMENDRTETKNLAGDKSNLLRQLIGRWEQWMLN